MIKGDEMEVRKRRRLRCWSKLHPYEDYRDFGQQPFILTLEIGYALIPLAEQEKGALLLEEIKHLRNEIDGEYGLTLPAFHIRDNSCIEPNEYRLLLHGTEITKFENARIGYCLCIDTGAVTKELVGEKTKEPAFGMDAIYLPENRREEAASAGYVVADLEIVIRTHLKEVIKKNLTKFLDQCMVNTLINKVRDRNPDVVDDVFFMHNFSTSKFKTILNLLLDEGINIRDMNTILETIADNLEKTQRPTELLGLVREKLAYQFLPKLADKKKVIHVIRVSKNLSEALIKHIYFPKLESPYIALEPDERKKLNEEITRKTDSMKEKGYEPVFMMVSDLRMYLSDYIRHWFGNGACISDLELYSVSKDISIVVEEELDVDEIKVNESCSCGN